jgi:DNA invertase Pin-like site-specific DNA recombinase
MTTTKPAVGYIRMSTDKQEDDPARQQGGIDEMAKRHGYRIIRWFEDHRISGA